MKFFIGVYLVGLVIGVCLSLAPDEEEGALGGIPALLGILASIFWPLVLPVLAVGFLYGLAIAAIKGDRQ